MRAASNARLRLPNRGRTQMPIDSMPWKIVPGSQLTFWENEKCLYH